MFLFLALVKGNRLQKSTHHQQLQIPTAQLIQIWLQVKEYKLKQLIISLAHQILSVIFPTKVKNKSKMQINLFKANKTQMFTTEIQVALEDDLKNQQKKCIRTIIFHLSSIQIIINTTMLFKND